MTSRESTPSGIPHRFLLLAMLRSLAAGNLLVIAGPGAAVGGVRGALTGKDRD